MKNGSLPVVLLALLLIAGLAGGAYFLLSADGDEQETRVSEHDDDGPKARDDNHAVNKPVIKDTPDSGKGSAEPITDPKTTPEPTDPEPAEPDVVKPEPALPEPPQPADAEWVEETFETKIHGIVRYRKDNRPVPGAEVTAEVADSGGGMTWGGPARAVLPESDPGKPKTKVVGTATTDNQGKYELTLKVTTYREKSDSSDKGGVEDLGGGGLTENWGGWGGESFVAVAKSPGFAPAKSSWLSLTKGQDQEVNLSIAIPAMISGRVIDASTGEGLAGASVTLNPIDTDQGWSAELNATTDAEGQFKIDVSAGQFMISVSAEGYADKGGWQSGISRIDASEGGDVIVDDIAMLKAGSVIGIIVDDEGKPVEGAMVSSESGAGGWAGFSTNTTITDKAGIFKIDSLKPGAFTLNVRTANFAHKAVENLNISSGQTLDLGEIALDRGVSLTGTVSGPDGSPVADAMVLIRKLSESAFNWAGAGPLVANTATDAEGNFE
ncbi:MAG: carboxypeptidase regulatory-like domain-containing protein, partial [Planctomycetes bacterium]|nr:carboxypeptidase regulatory-like domain-containing protein [Planctomycetota bacterium]